MLVIIRDFQDRSPPGCEADLSSEDSVLRRGRFAEAHGAPPLGFESQAHDGRVARSRIATADSARSAHERRAPRRGPTARCGLSVHPRRGTWRCESSSCGHGGRPGRCDLETFAYVLEEVLGRIRIGNSGEGPKSPQSTIAASGARGGPSRSTIEVAESMVETWSAPRPAAALDLARSLVGECGARGSGVAPHPSLVGARRRGLSRPCRDRARDRADARTRRRAAKSRRRRGERRASIQR